MRTVLKSIGFVLITSLFFTACQKESTTQLAPPIADAGNTHAIAVPPSSDTLHGSGTSTNGIITAYLWSLVSGPNVPVIVSPGSATTVVNNLVPGTYTFQLMVVDGAGLTGTDTVKVYATAAPTTTVTIQPTNNTTEVSMVYYPAVGNFTNPGTPEILAHAWTNGGNTYNGRAMLKFDLSSIPAGATITSAKLSLYSINPPLNGNFIDANFGSNNAMYIERITGSWTTTTLWQNQPGTDAASQILIPHTPLSFLDLIDVDVTNQVSAMKTIANWGFMFRLQNETPYNMRDFCSSRNATASKHPKLVITYQ